MIWSYSVHVNFLNTKKNQFYRQSNNLQKANILSFVYKGQFTSLQQPRTSNLCWGPKCWLVTTPLQNLNLCLLPLLPFHCLPDDYTFDTRGDTWEAHCEQASTEVLRRHDNSEGQSVTCCQPTQHCWQRLFIECSKEVFLHRSHWRCWGWRRRLRLWIIRIFSLHGVTQFKQLLPQSL